MGTRADFYIRRGEQAEWLGSIAWDGHPGSIPEDITQAKNVDLYRRHVVEFIASRKDGTKPEDGWPWPWEDSQTTDYAYSFDEGHVFGCCFGHGWFDTREDEPEEHPDGKNAVFPNMKNIQKVTLGKRSGVIIIGG